MPCPTVWLMFFVFALRRHITSPWWWGLCCKPQGSLQTPYIHPAGTASVFSFHMIGVTPHSCYNFSAAHKKSPLQAAEPCVLNFPTVCSHLQSLSPFLLLLPSHLSHSLTHAHTEHWASAAFVLIGPFSPHESIPLRCIWGYGCHWQPVVREWQPLSMLGVSTSAYSTQSDYWWSLALWTQTHQRKWCVTKTASGIW